MQVRKYGVADRDRRPSARRHGRARDGVRGHQLGLPTQVRAARRCGEVIADAVHGDGRRRARARHRRHAFIPTARCRRRWPTRTRFDRPCRTSSATPSNTARRAAAWTIAIDGSSGGFVRLSVADQRPRHRCRRSAARVQAVLSRPPRRRRAGARQRHRPERRAARDSVARRRCARREPCRRRHDGRHRAADRRVGRVRRRARGPARPGAAS